MKNNFLKNQKRVMVIPREVFLLIILGLLMFFMYLGNSNFLTLYNLQSIIANNFEIGFISVIMTCVILMAGIDLSVGSVAGLMGMLTGVFFVQLGWNFGVSAIIAIIIGTGVGMLNGAIIVSLEADPLVVTLGSMVLFRAVARMITEGWPISGFPKGLMFLSHGSFLGVRIPIYVFILFLIGIHYLLSRTVFGQSIYSIGNNENATFFSGIKVRKVKFILYLLSGFVSSIAGLFLLARLITAQPDAGTGFDMEAIAAVVIGGTDIFGGEGSVIGTLLGFLMIAVIKNGLNLMGISPLIQTITIGILLIFTIWINNILKERRKRLLIETRSYK